MTKTALMIHGAGGGGWEWKFWEPVFQKHGWRTVVRDLTPRLGDLEKTTFDDYVDQTWGSIPLDAGPLVLIGASLGGILALKTAERRRPDALILVNSVPPAGISRKTPPTDYPPLVKWAGGPIEETRAAMPDSDEETIQFAWRRWRDESGAVLNTIGKGVGVRPPSCPALVIIGENDTDIAPETSRALAARLRADTHTYAVTSHVGPLLGRRATEIAEAASLWLDGRLTRPTK